MDETPRPCLIVVFRDHPLLALAAETPVGIFKLGDSTYYDVENNDWLGFYDWLRETSDKIIGVRFAPFRELYYILHALVRFSFAVVDWDSHSVEIFFSNARYFEPKLSVNQDFGENRILRSRENEYAITFGISCLNEAEIESIARLRPDLLMLE